MRPPVLDRRCRCGSLRALALANARYWPSVAPVVRAELARWSTPAGAIADATLRELAVGKLREERFNAEVAATLATLAPRPERASATRAIVTLELLFDYLDGRTELPSSEPLADGMRLFDFFTGALDPSLAPQGAGSEQVAARSEETDGAYIKALADSARRCILSLPSAERIAPIAQAAAERCAQAQTRLHAATVLGYGQLNEWASQPAKASGLGWREYVAGSASSVLSVHALIAAAATPQTSLADARRIDTAYLAIGGVITMLDSLVDRNLDLIRGEAGFIRLFADDVELELSLLSLTQEALRRARAAPNGEHHVMTLAGAVAYYTTHPGARQTQARRIAKMLRRELSPTIWPGLAVVLGWRGAKRARASIEAAASVDRARRSAAGDAGGRSPT